MKRSPAFQFYPRDFLSSSKVARMSMTARGVYITLLCHCWLDEGLPADHRALAKMVGLPPSRFERIWPELAQNFCQKLDRYINSRLEIENQVQINYRQNQQKHARKRWATHADPLPRAGNAPLPLPHVRTEEVLRTSSVRKEDDGIWRCPHVLPCSNKIICANATACGKPTKAGYGNA